MTRLGFACALGAIGLLGACASEGSSQTTSPPVSTPATSPAPTEAAIDCDGLKSTLGKVVVNVQILAQLPGMDGVSAWPVDIGTMSEFGGQLDTLSALEPFGDGVTDSLDFYRGANEIAQRGYAGDVSASADLAEYLGPQLGAVLSRQVALSMALDAAGC